MKKVLIVFLLFCFLKGASQTAFPWVGTYNTDNVNVMTTVFSLKNGELLFTGCNAAPTGANIPYMKVAPRLYRTSASGALIATQQFVKLGTAYVQFISNVFEEADDSLVLIGDGLNDPDSVPTIIYAKCDYALNVGTVKTFPIPLDTADQGKYCSSSWLGGSLWKRHPDGGYYGSMDVNGFRRNPGWQRWGPLYILYYRMDQAGTILSYAKEPARYLYDRRSNLEYSSTLRQYVTTAINQETHWVDSSFTFIKFDTSKWWGYPEVYGDMELRGANTILPYKGKHLLVGGYSAWVDIPGHPNNGEQQTSINVTMLNDSFRITSRHLLRPPCPNCSDSLAEINRAIHRITTEFQSVDYRNEDSIFFACYSSPIWDLPSYSVFMADSTFTVQWGSTQTIENFASLQSVKATPDGGCIVTGNTKLNNQFFMFIQKFEKTGFPSGIRYFEDGMKEIAVYPNPGSGKIRVSGDAHGRTFTLYDLNGRSVATGTDAELMDGIDVSALAPGMYVYTIRRHIDGTTTTGKWVKQ